MVYCKLAGARTRVGPALYCVSPVWKHTAAMVAARNSGRIPVDTAKDKQAIYYHKMQLFGVWTDDGTSIALG